jgi:hypothetical protein
MSPELETLDQLQGSDMPVKTIRSLFPTDDKFLHSIKAMLASGEIQLLENGVSIPQWRFQDCLAAALSPENTNSITLSITKNGAKRIA